MSVYGPLADFYDSLTEDVDYPGLYDYLMWHFRQGVSNFAGCWIWPVGRGASLCCLRPGASRHWEWT